MKYKLLVILVSILFCSCDYTAEENLRWQLKGTVVDDNLIPIQNAIVSLQTRRLTLLSALTNPQGQINANTLAFNDELILEIKKEGFGDYRKVSNSNFFVENNTLDFQSQLLVRKSVINLKLSNTSNVSQAIPFNVSYTNPDCYILIDTNGGVDDINSQCNRLIENSFNLQNSVLNSNISRYEVATGSPFTVRYLINGTIMTQTFNPINTSESYEVQY